MPPDDPTTGALSMPAFSRAYAECMAAGGRPLMALWYVDIRNFRSVNPKFGYLSGNLVLRTLVQGVRQFLCHDLPITRLGADRFIFLTAGYEYEQAQERFQELVRFLNERIAEGGVSNHLSLTAGMYYLRESDFEVSDFKRALDYTSIAHRNARRDKHSTLLMFTKEDLERDMRRITIEQSIDQALATGQIEVWFQPQIDYTYGDVVGAEALARWNHPDLGWISPAEFIPVLENCGRVHDLDLFVWEEACRSAGRWRSFADTKPVPISVNVSRSEITEPGLIEHFLNLQKKYNLPDGSLHLEVTESAFVEEAERLYSIIEDMRAHNMTVEMDDFGSGLSSLNMLKDVPVDVVKLDMGFMRTAVNEERGGVVLGSVIRMLQGLDTPIIAEGVETLEQAEMLKNMGCHLMQGFHFSRPMPLEEFEGYIASNNAVDRAQRRERRESHLEDLMSFDAGSSFLFNNAIGGTMLFFSDGETSESILVNDQFYEDCGLRRGDFGDAKINPIQEIDPASRATLWRAAAEARDNGSALCVAQVRMTGRWIECVMRYIGSSSRGDIFALNVCRSGAIGSEEKVPAQIAQDFGWKLDLLDKVVPNAFLKCRPDDSLGIAYVSPELVDASGLARDEFMRRYHNSFIELVAVSDRARLLAAVTACMSSGEVVDMGVLLHRGFEGYIAARVIGRIAKDKAGESWFYALVLVLGAAEAEDDDAAAPALERTIPFDYHVAEDLLVVHAPMLDGSVQDVSIPNWVARLDALPDNIAPSSATKVIATLRDLRAHPVSGFSDIKCNLRGGEALRWYHVNYVCDADENGMTTVVHGYAQDANDQMGSAKWWRRQAEIDHLTGLLNRNAVEQEINLAMHTQGGGLMFMIDLDGFKRVNDELGHLSGDELLRHVADTLALHFREGDVLGRYGGDEFVAFMPITGGDARQTAERRARDIIDAVKAIVDAGGYHAGCSVGVAMSGNRESTFYDLLEVADQAMYKSKLAGKGTFTVLEAE